MHAVKSAVPCASIDRSFIRERIQCSVRALGCFEKVGEGRQVLMRGGEVAVECPILRTLHISCRCRPQQNVMSDGRVEENPRFKN